MLSELVSLPVSGTLSRPQRVGSFESKQVLCMFDMLGDSFKTFPPKVKQRAPHFRNHKKKKWRKTLSLFISIQIEISLQERVIKGNHKKTQF